jgi:hypothetical protein
MASRSAAATDAARRVWTRAAGDSRGPEALTAAAEQLRSQLSTGLGRWIGAQGYRALLERAGELARTERSALGAEEAAVGQVALLAALIELLGRIIGEEMAVRLVEQSGMPSPPGLVSTETEGSRNG